MASLASTYALKIKTLSCLKKILVGHRSAAFLLLLTFFRDLLISEIEENWKLIRETSRPHADEA